jgi:hypothetical protein
MGLAEVLIALGDLRRRAALALVEFSHYAKRNIFGFTFLSMQIMFIVGYAFATQHEGWSDRYGSGDDAEYSKETAPEEAIPSKLNSGNGLQALFLSLLGQGLMYSYLRKYAFSAIGFSFLIGIMILEWGLLLRYFFEVPLPSFAAFPLEQPSSFLFNHAVAFSVFL